MATSAKRPDGAPGTIPDPQPLALRPLEAARTLGISPRKLWELSARREGPPIVRLGRAVLYPTAGLAAWLESQSQKEARR